MSHFFEEVSNVKNPSRYYIDDKGIRFDRKDPHAWDNTLKFIMKGFEENS
jgi:hypothetical protein